MKKIIIRILETLYPERCERIRHRRIEKRRAMDLLLQRSRSFRAMGYSSDYINATLADSLSQYEQL